MATRLEGCAISGAKRSAIFVKVHISGRQTSAGIEWDNSFSKAVIIEQKIEVIIAVESGAGGKDAVMKAWMSCLEIQQNRLERGGISNFFINFRMICAFSDLRFRVGHFEIIVKKFQMTHNAQPVGHNRRFLRITEMPVDITSEKKARKIGKDVVK